MMLYLILLGIELDDEYSEIIEKRMQNEANRELF